MKRWDRRSRADPERLARWALAYGGDAGVDWGLACEPSGVTVVDVDPRSGGGVDSVADLPPTLCAMTPSGGWHLFYQGVVPSKVGWRKGVDLKGRGGYVVVPSEGDTERWWIDPEVSLAPVPDWMVPRSPEPSPPAPAAQRSGVGRGGYGTAALEGEADRVRETGEGGRNDALYRAAFRMGQLIAQGDVSMTDSEHELGAAAESAGLGSEEAKRTLSNGHRDGASVPRSGYSVGSSGDGGGKKSPYLNTKGGIKPASVIEEVTRDSSGERDVAWGVDGVFWQYVGGVWQPCEEQSVIESRMCRLLGDDYKKSQVATVESYARTIVPRLDPQPDPTSVNFRNGMVDIATGELREHDRWEFSTVQLAVEYSPGDSTVEFDEFLTTVVPEDAIPVVWEAIAYGLYSGNPFEKAVMLVGPTRSGKGTTLGVLETILGGSNMSAVPLHRLARERFAAASLLSVTANICGDIDNNHIDQPAVIKSLTGNDPISAERKGRDRFTFTPWATLFFGANLIPTTSDTSSAFANRWLILPFSYSHADHVDHTLKPRMKSKRIAQAVASRAVREFLPPLLDRGGFTRSASTDLAHREFQSSLSSMEMWIYERCEQGDGVYQLKDLYENYCDWCRESGHQAASDRKLSQTLSNHFERGSRQGGVRGWKLRLSMG